MFVNTLDRHIDTERQRQTETETDIETDRQANRQTGRHTGRQTDRQADRHTDMQIIPYYKKSDKKDETSSAHKTPDHNSSDIIAG